MSAPDELAAFEHALALVSRDESDASQRLRKHVNDVTWFGGEQHMPTFVDSHTQALWQGWQLRATTNRITSTVPPGRSIRLIPPGCTHMQYGAQRRMTVGDWLASPHYDEPGWTPVRMERVPGPHWQVWGREGWK